MDRSRERDESIVRLLSHPRHVARETDPAASCLDAETMAAWLDGGLSGASLESAESHVAGCSRCQTLLATLSRIDVPGPHQVPAPSSRRWLGWLVPLAAATTAIAIWIAVPRDSPSVSVPPSAAKVTAGQPAPAGDPPPPPAAAPDNSQSVPRRTEERQARAFADAANNAAARSESAPRAKQRVSEAPGVAVRPDAEARDTLRGQSGEAAAPVSPTPPPAPAAGTAALAAPPSPRLERALGAVQSAAGRAGARVEILSPDPMARWRITGPRVERSIDGGSSWDVADIPNGADLTAGAAPSAMVCWVVGRGGVVLLTTDGRSWRRVAFAEGVDLTAVRATDARTASVTTADGRTFRTTDGGATWVRLLQEF